MPMVEWPVPLTETRGLLDRAAQIEPGAAHRHHQVPPLAETNGNRRGEGTACAMGVPGLKAQGRKTLDIADIGNQNIGQLIPGEVPALH